MTTDPSPARSGESSINSRAALVVTAFGVLTLLLVLLANGGSVPETLNIEATNIERTHMAEAALSPPAPVRWIKHILGRRKAVHDLIFINDTLLLATDDGLLAQDASGAWTPVPGFPVDAVPVRLWMVDDILWAGLEDGQAATFDGSAWDGPMPVALVFAPLFRVTGPIPFDVDALCDVSGIIRASDGTYWAACPESVVHVQADAQTRYTSVDGLPGAPTGAIREGPDGTIWFGLDTGAAGLRLDG